MKLFKPYLTDIDLKTKNAEQHTALWLAAQAGKLDIVKWLLGESADINIARISDGRTALQAAIASKHIEIVKFLIANGADINKGDNAKASPLYYSVQLIDSGIEHVHYLINKGADINMTVLDPIGYTSLHMASWLGNTRAVMMLVKAGANINVVDERGYSPLFSALWEYELTSRENKLDIVKYLIASGAKLSQIGKEGEKPLELAKKYLPEAVTWLEHPENLPNIKILESNFMNKMASAKEQQQQQQSSTPTDVVNKVMKTNTVNSEKNTDNIYKDNAGGDDRNLADNGNDSHYWYSISDACRLEWNLRETILHYNNAARIGEKYAAMRENTNRVFLADPYYVTNFAEYLKDDVARISATGDFSNLASWGSMPTTIIIPLLSGSHWRAVKVDIDYTSGISSISLNDPYGAGGFSADLKATIKEAVKINAQVLIRKQTGNGAFNITGDLPITEDAIDQQGRGNNGWDCGPITFSNIKDYLEFVTGVKSGLNWSIDAYNEQGHVNKITALREADVTTYMRVTGSLVNQSRINEAKDALEEAGKDLVKQVKVAGNFDTELISKLSKLDAFHLGILFEALESHRLLSGLSSKDPYNPIELKNAYKAVEAEVIRASSFNNGSANKNFKVSQATDFDYSNKLLNHFELLKSAITKGKLNLSKAVNSSKELDSELIVQVIAGNDEDLLLAGLLSLEQTINV